MVRSSQGSLLKLVLLAGMIVAALSGCAKFVEHPPGFSSDATEDRTDTGTPPKSGVIPGKYIVVYKDGGYGTFSTPSGPGVQVQSTYHSAIQGYSAQLSDDKLQNVLKDPRVAYVEPDQYFSVAARQPDVTISAMDVQPTEPQLGEMMTVRVRVTNRGNGIAYPFRVSLYGNLDAEPKPGDAESVSRWIPFLFPGQSRVVTFRGRYGNAGRYRMWALADSGDDLDESNEANNAAGPILVTVGGGSPAGAPELQIASVTPSTTVPAVNQSFRVDVVVKNLGDKDAGAFSVGLAKNAASSMAPDYEKPIPGLPAGAAATVSFDLAYAAAGTYQIRAIADSRDEVQEGDEQNNVSGPVSIAVGGAPSTGNQEIPTGIRRILATESSAKSGDGSGEVDVTVAIIDTGIDLKNPELNVVLDKTFVPGTTSGQDGFGHGSHVAGTVAARDNDSGVVGVAPGAKLWAVRVLDDQGSGTLSGILDGMNFVAGRASEVQVVNMSLGGGFSQALNDAAEKLVAAGVTVVVAAGNENQDVKNVSPASAPNVITVAALADSDGLPGGKGPATKAGADDTMATFSNFGAGVDFIAPGVDILSTLPGGRFERFSGTSMASPHVAGLAALIKSRNRGYSPAQVREAMMQAVRERINSRGIDYPLIDASRF